MTPGLLPQVCDEPLAGKASHHLQGAGFFEQMGRTRHDLEAGTAAEQGHGSPVELDDGRVVLTDDQQRGLAYEPEELTGQVRSTAARHDRLDRVRARGCGD